MRIAAQSRSSQHLTIHQHRFYLTAHTCTRSRVSDVMSIERQASNRSCRSATVWSADASLHLRCFRRESSNIFHGTDSSCLTTLAWQRRHAHLVSCGRFALERGQHCFEGIAIPNAGCHCQDGATVVSRRHHFPDLVFHAENQEKSGDDQMPRGFQLYLLPSDTLCDSPLAKAAQNHRKKMVIYST